MKTNQLSDDEIAALAARFAGPVDLNVVLGMLAAIASAPVPPATSDWMGRVRGSLSTSASEGADGDASLLLDLLATVRARLEAGAPLVPAADDLPALREWCFGYLAGGSLDPSWAQGDEDLHGCALIAAIARVEENEHTRELDSDPPLARETCELVGPAAVSAYRALSARRARGRPGHCSES